VDVFRLNGENGLRTEDFSPERVSVSLEMPMITLKIIAIFQILVCVKRQV
jgi:hypothetical protein